MAITIKLDTADDSQIEQFGNAAFSATRGGVAYDLPNDTSTMQPEDVLYAIMTAPGMPAMGSSYPGVPFSFLTRIRVLGQNSQVARFQLVYEPFQGVGTSLIIDVGSSLSTYATNMMPGSREPFALSYALGTAEERVPDDYPIINMLRPVRRISVTQLKAGSLDVAEAAAFGDYVGKVNDATWQGKPPGGWIIGEAQASISKYNGYYSRRIGAMSQGSDLWSHYAILRSQVTGKYVGTKDTIKATVDALVALPYSAKSQRPDPADGGVIRVDPYDTTTFADLFGF